MFAFGLYDSKVGLFLVRDRLGIKPLYYHVDDTGALRFGSEVRSLLASGQIAREWDGSAVTGFLLTGSMPAPATAVKGVKTVPAGHYLAWRDGRVAITKYWDLTYGASEPNVSGEGIGAVLQDAVSRHLISDVPLGVFLS